jgi:serine/threonine protein kinase
VGQLDYCPGGEVFSYLRRARRFNEPTSQFYAAEIVLILENILIDAEGHLKLVDFGFAKKVENRQSSLPRGRNGALTSRRGDLHSVRHSRVSGAGGHKKHRWVALVPAQWLNSHS